jgi:hypothetical protein
VRLETNEAPTVAIAMFGWTVEVVVSQTLALSARSLVAIRARSP